MFFEFNGIVYNRNHVISVGLVTWFDENFDGWEGWGFAVSMTDDVRWIIDDSQERLNDKRVKFLNALTADGTF